MDEIKIEKFFAVVVLLATVMLVAFKFSGVVNWSWLWVLSPLWITVVVVLLTMAVMYLTAVFKK